MHYFFLAQLNFDNDIDFISPSHNFFDIKMLRDIPVFFSKIKCVYTNQSDGFFTNLEQIHQLKRNEVNMDLNFFEDSTLACAAIVLTRILSSIITLHPFQPLNVKSKADNCSSVIACGHPLLLICVDHCQVCICIYVCLSFFSKEFQIILIQDG